MNSLNTKTRALKRDKEEAEGEVETSKSKLRQLRAQVEEAEENASSLQAQVTKLRSASRKKVDMDTRTSTAIHYACVQCVGLLYSA